MQEAQVNQESKDFSNTDGIDPRVESIVDAKISEYKQAHGGQSPSGKIITQWRKNAEIGFVPISRVFKRMFAIGNPEAVGVRAPQKNEFEMLATELDRREQMYLGRKPE